MRRQTKLVAVLSAAALLALGASMTSFAAGWEKDEDGIWHYYDSENDGIDQDDVKVTTDSSGKVKSIESTENYGFSGLGGSKKATSEELIAAMIYELKGENNLENVDDDMIVSVPFIQLYDDDIYTYYEMDEDGSNPREGWLCLNVDGKDGQKVSSKDGIASAELHRTLKVNKKTAADSSDNGTEDNE